MWGDLKIPSNNTHEIQRLLGTMQLYLCLLDSYTDSVLVSDTDQDFVYWFLLGPSRRKLDFRILKSSSHTKVIGVMLEALIGHNQAQVMTYNIIDSKGASPHSCLVLRW